SRREPGGVGGPARNRRIAHRAPRGAAAASRCQGPELSGTAPGRRALSVARRSCAPEASCSGNCFRADQRHTRRTMFKASAAVLVVLGAACEASGARPDPRRETPPPVLFVEQPRAGILEVDAFPVQPMLRPPSSPADGSETRPFP